MWNRIFAKFYLTMDANLSHHFQQKDVVKSKRQLLQKTKEYKSSRSQNRYAKYVEDHVTRLEEMKTGVMYQTGVGVKAAKKSVKNQPHQEILKVHYSFCFTTGHRDCRTTICTIHGRRKDIRDAAMKEITRQAIAIEVEKIASEVKTC